MTAATVDDLARASAAVGDVITRVGPDQWTAPTPCSEWDVRAVVNHLVAGNRVFAARLDGGPLPDLRADYLGDDPLGAYQASAAALQDAFRRPGALEQTSAGPLGDATGAELLQIRLYDLLAHGWDLSQATGVAADLPDDLAEQALAFVRDQLSTRPRTGRFDEPQPIDDAAPPIERLAAFLGRKVR